MPAPSKQHDKAYTQVIDSLPLDQATWTTIAHELSFSTQQTRIVELILCGQQDAEIADQLGLSVHTVRTYIRRIFDHAQVKDRLILVLKIFAMAQALVGGK